MAKILSTPASETIIKPNNNKVAILLVAFENFTKNTSIAKKWSKDTQNFVTYVGSLLVLNFSKDRDIKSIKRDELLEFRNTLLKLPPKISQNNLYKGKSLDQIVALAKDKEKISATTVKKYIIRIQEFFKYCVDSDYIEKSPATNLNIKLTDEDSIYKKTIFR